MVGTKIIPSVSSPPNHTVQDFCSPVSHDLSEEIHNLYTDKRKTGVSKVKDVDGKMFGPPFKTMKSEFVTWKEAIRAKKYDLYDEK